MQALPTVSLIVPTYRRPEAITLTMRAIADLDYPRDLIETIVVDDDDGSGDVTSLIQDLGYDVPGMRGLTQSHRGAAAARNHGAREATGQLLLFLDDDMIVQPDHLRRHVAVQGTYGPCLTNGHWEFSEAVAEELRATPFGRFRLDLEQWVKTGVALEPLGDGCFIASGVTAADLCIPREIFWSLHGFDETFPHAGYEDQDLSLRAAAAHHRFVYAETIRLRHHDQRSSLSEFCHRQMQGATTAVHLVTKEPELAWSRPFVIAALPVSPEDPMSLRAKKVAKTILSGSASLALVHMVIDVLARVAPNARVLRRAYWWTLGLYIFRGVRIGLRRFPGTVERILESTPDVIAPSGVPRWKP